MVEKIDETKLFLERLERATDYIQRKENDRKETRIIFAYLIIAVVTLITATGIVCSFVL